MSRTFLLAALRPCQADMLSIELSDSRRCLSAHVPAYSINAKAGFWDETILRWERARYSFLALANPFAWTVRERMRLAQLLLRIEFQHCRSILDLGCGSGYLAYSVIDHDNRQYMGLDFSRMAIGTGRRRFQRYSSRVRFEQRDILEAARLDAQIVVFLGLLDWLDDDEIRRLFSTFNGQHLLFSFTETAGGLAGTLYRQYRRCADKTYHARSFYESQIIESAELGGYRVETVLRSLRLGPGRLVVASKK